jgi:rubrerythrin
MNQERNICLEQAIRMEKDGKEFYVRAASTATSPAVRMIFEELARQEDFHVQKIGEIFGAIQKTQALTEWVMCVIGDSKLESLFDDKAAAQANVSVSDLDALSFGLQLEEKSIKYYDELVVKSQDKYEKRFYLTLSHEERGHYLKIMDSVELLSNPEGWNYVKGRGMVDGG